MSSSRERAGRRRVARLAALGVQATLHAGLLVSLAAVVTPEDFATAPSAPESPRRPAVPPVLIGSVARLDTQAFAAATYAGERTVRVEASTLVVTAAGPSGFAALCPGCGVIVWGARRPDGTLLARRILVGAVP